MNFPKRAFYRLLYLSQILPKWTDFNEIKEITDFNQFLKESLLPKNEQNEHISMKSRKLQKYHILANFQKRASYRLVYLYEILSIFIKSPDFNEIKEND